MNGALEGLSLVFALILASVTAAMSSGPQERKWISNYIAEALTPTIVDLGPYAFTDPENLIVIVPGLRR